MPRLRSPQLVYPESYQRVLIISLLLSSFLFAPPLFAAPPSSPYTPGETLNPSCSPGDANCTVVAPPAGTGSAGLLTYWTASSTVSSSLSLFWDNPNIRLGIGTSQPSSTLHIIAGTTGATTLQLMGLPNQTGNLLTIGSSSGQRYFTVSSLGLASSTEFRSPSSTIGALFDTQGNKYATSTFTAGVDTQLLFGALGGGATSSLSFTFATSTSQLLFSGSNLSIAPAATSTSLVFLQGTQTGSTTLLAMGMAGQTANLFSLASSNGVRFFEVTNAGVASSTYFIAVNASTTRLDVSGSSTLKDFTFTSASSTGSITIGGTFQSNAGQTTLGSVSSTNLFASGYGFLTKLLSSSLGIGTNPTSTALALFQTQSLASTTLLVQATSSQTGDLFTVSSSTGLPVFFNINSIGQIGIATSTYPSSSTLLTIASSSQIFNISSGGNIMIGTSTSPNGALLTIATTTNILTVLSSGNVGIGTSTPSQKLTVVGTIESTSGGVKFPNGATQTVAGTALSNVRIYTANDTWSKPAGLHSVVVWVVGGGGGGGGSATTAAGEVAVAGGGGGGGTSMKRVVAASLGATETVTVGAGGAGGAAGANAGSAGGTSSFGAHLSATGGTGGPAGTNGASPRVSGDNAAGGIGSGGDINIKAGYGGHGIGLNSTTVTSGVGGSSHFGGGGQGVDASGGAVGGAYGGGGSGAGLRQSATQAAGGAGAAGVVIVYEYLQ